MSLFSDEDIAQVTRWISTEPRAIQFEYRQPRQCYSSFRIECVSRNDAGDEPYAMLANLTSLTAESGLGYCDQMRPNRAYTIRTTTTNRQRRSSRSVILIESAYSSNHSFRN